MIKKGERTEYPFHLRPFASTGETRGISLRGRVQRFSGEVFINYRLEGDLQSLVLPAPNRGFSRRHELWRKTCFELFFSVPDEASYWEVNLAPDGDWNCYNFAGYRREMQEEAAMDGIISHTDFVGREFSLSCHLPLGRLVADDQPLVLGIAAVLVDTAGAVSYWALDHCNNMPDFHDKTSFILQIAPMVKR